jgi:hypothetical protein
MSWAKRLVFVEVRRKGGAARAVDGVELVVDSEYEQWYGESGFLYVRGEGSECDTFVI